MAKFQPFKSNLDGIKATLDYSTDTKLDSYPNAIRFSLDYEKLNQLFLFE